MTDPKIAEYRERAATARTKAERAADRDSKKTLLDIANSWDSMADEREAGAGRLAQGRRS